MTKSFKITHFVPSMARYDFEQKNLKLINTTQHYNF